MPKFYLLCHRKKDHNEGCNYNSVGDHQQINREAYRLLTETKQTGLIKSESHTEHGIMTAKHGAAFFADQQSCWSCCWLKSTTHWEAFYLHSKNLRLQSAQQEIQICH